MELASLNGRHRAQSVSLILFRSPKNNLRNGRLSQDPMKTDLVAPESEFGCSDVRRNELGSYCHVDHVDF